MKYYGGRHGGHAPSQVRNAFVAAVCAFEDWDGSGDEPSVEYEDRHAPRQITLTQACGLVWNCNDILPGGVFRALRAHFEKWDGHPDDRLKRQTYACAARAMRAFIEEMRTEQHDTAA